MVKKLIPQSIKNIYHLFQAILANFMYGWLSKNIKIIGVTGTNGKTTTVQMITKILEESGARVAMASTINFKLGEKEWVNATKFTTLSSFQVQKFIAEAVKANCEYLVLETSSHSLDQFRTWGIRYDTAVITNVTREHLDYHKTIEGYRQAKLKLFKNVKNAVVNLDMEKPEEFLKYNNKNIFLYSCHPELVSGSRFRIPCLPAGRKSGMTLIQAEDIELGIDNTKYQIGDIKYQINLPGLFNMENALAAICVVMAYGISAEVIKNALEKIQGVPGRMEKVPNDRGIEIIIDYAVTPDSLEKLYTLIKLINTKKTKVISVLGACGERDRGKRPMMGEIVSRFADYIIVTNEDPYNEDPMQIINEVASGIKNKIENENFWIIMDRREAIKKALQIASPRDIFVITGKGAEEVMAIGKQRIPWNEKKVILEELENLK
ncbi:MAG: UDP-N-acetylmuramyl-tripeptide synthetase [Candidatus Moranbacteria bacterium GW2011_GWF2_36_839]|nr:MAG: UDP-N-acetylmuramyl-tripeptide synthetase [Candidatus Moranbacteria bacterium GW2011_GWF1_36_78]KKQ17083.1 MAG: UDP-N-acetylmuramyl-tripeptide synthetase [Candidatus Moranbacteria bacterium GW2011_GWF2_36_839]HAT73686.1 UDP-N-acetylmuramoyl-L-alanyl-D-glutamate--2,6-diaminopimelate ligase [Candidatus Moranbacteria bacterium]HBY11338.1 UDP-N-acetylmuramoyl-L-alanyl-D-glutamate--2,6-diaminopimelate ligase [Candidatus Moranbacteria bacterium]